MSFIYEDENLIFQFMKLAQDVPEVGSAPRTAPTDGSEHIELAKQLVSNLQKQLSGEHVFSTENDNDKLNLSNVLSLENFLSYLADNKIKDNGKLIVFKTSDPIAQSISRDELHSKYVIWPSDKTESADQFDEDSQYYINKESLSYYLAELKEQVKTKRIFTQPLNDLSARIQTELSIKAAPSTRSPVAGSPAQTTTPQQQQQQGQGVAGTSDANTMTKLIGALSSPPLVEGNIDFNRITEFLNEIGPVISPAYAPSANALINSIKRDMDITKSKLIGGNPVIPLTYNKVAFRSLIEGDHTKQLSEYFSVIESLKRILSQTHAVLLLVYNNYKQFFTDPKNKSAYNAISQQIGLGGGNPYSVFNSNMNVLTNLEQAGGKT